VCSGDAGVFRGHERLLIKHKPSYINATTGPIRSAVFRGDKGLFGGDKVVFIGH